MSNFAFDHICCHLLQNLESSCNPIVNKPKPKVEPPKDDDKDKATTEDDKNKATTEDNKATTEDDKMEDDSKKDEEKSEGATATTQPSAAEDMDVD